MAAEKMTKTKIVKVLAEKTGLSKPKVEEVLEEIFLLAKGELGKKGPGEFTIPKVVKLRVVKKKATKERMGRNPATGQPIKIPAKKAHSAVKATVLKATKELV
jgi:nucleoid DNA-binding protein